MTPDIDPMPQASTFVATRNMRLPKPIKDTSEIGKKRNMKDESSMAVHKITCSNIEICTSCASILYIYIL